MSGEQDQHRNGTSCMLQISVPYRHRQLFLLIAQQKLAVYTSYRGKVCWDASD